jgi:protein transport protein SEC61 subunit gamma-like protein
MEVADFAYKPVKEFAKDSIRLIRKCTKPDKKEFSKVALRTGMGFIVMGFVGFFVKLILCVAVLARSPSSVLRPLLHRRRRRPSRVASRLRSSSCAAIAARAEERSAMDRSIDRSCARGASPRSSRLFRASFPPPRAFAPRSTVHATDVPALARSSRSIPINNIILAA